MKKRALSIQKKGTFIPGTKSDGALAPNAPPPDPRSLHFIYLSYSHSHPVYLSPFSNMSIGSNITHALHIVLEYSNQTEQIIVNL